MPVIDGERLPDGEAVLRLWHKSKDGNISPIAFDPSPQSQVSPEVFALSSTEKKDPNPRLSVWALSLTTHAQACFLLGRASEETLFIQLSVDKIRLIRPNPDDSKITNLDVIWHIIDGEQMNGIAGHAGITGLAQKTVANRGQRLSFRQKLAKIALIVEFTED